jgi:hypothetical protein
LKKISSTFKLVSVIIIVIRVRQDVTKEICPAEFSALRSKEFLAKVCDLMRKKTPIIAIECGRLSMCECSIEMYRFRFSFQIHWIQFVITILELDDV